jgi:hypothetical protein
MKKFSQTYKKDILIAALEERYEAMHVIRERVQSICVWTLGLMVTAAGWLMQNDIFIPPSRILFYLVALCVVLWTLRFKYLSDLQRGFSSQQRVAARLESALSLYTPGVFDKAKDSIYPKRWEHAGSGNSEGKFFSSTYLLLYIGVVILSLALMFQADWFNIIYTLINSKCF